MSRTNSVRPSAARQSSLLHPLRCITFGTLTPAIRMARILLVDDDDTLREMLALALSAVGHTVTHASDGRQGIDLVRAQPMDLVVLDLVMPGQEGIETLTVLQREFHDLPVIVVSGGGLTDPKAYLRVAANLGARRTLAKPFAVESLLSNINDLLAETS
jgi:two-component system, chemotaxis family, chemotaxis protein CheY